MATETNRFKWASLDRYELLRSFARENRKRQTPAESFLWEHIRQEQKEDDEVRTAHLEQLGFRVIRFSNEEVLYGIEDVLENIKDELRK